MRRYKGTFDVFFGKEHGLRKEEMEEQFSKEAKEGRGFAADAARITDENAGSEDRTHTSVGFLWQSTATWEQLWEWKKVRLSRSRKNCPSMGERQRRIAYLLSLLLALRGVVVKK